MKQIVAFDFDGTLTTKDTLIEFIRYACGTRAFLFGFLRYVHLLVLMKLGLYPNYKAKQKVFAHFFEGMKIEEFDGLCQRFAKDNQHLLRPKGVEAIQQAMDEGAEVLIVSASIDNWVREMITDPVIIGTQIEIKDGLLTGRFLTKNCYGQEKVNRILALYPHRSEYHLTAYGDSRGDKELLAFADESHYKPFRQL
ncbi:MAG: haloacid dehalogenase-like hydrolase [Prevotella sp.]|nr:haloacid dehalogenase-like hydrolase [Prevotella sp.]